MAQKESERITKLRIEMIADMVSVVSGLTPEEATARTEEFLRSLKITLDKTTEA